MAERIDRDEIRRMVRELLRDVAGSESRPAPDGTPAPGNGAVASGGGLSERVRAALEGGGGIEVAIANESDLNAFAQQVALCALERDLLGAIASNRVRFRLAGGGGAAPAATAERAAPRKAAQSTESTPAGRGGAYEWQGGLLNETKIAEIARNHDKLVLGPQAVLTPLARDRAGALGLQIVRMRR